MSGSLQESLKICDEISVGQQEPLLLIAGPCQIESLDHCLSVAETLQEMSHSLPIQLVFKSSYDKANRTSLDSTRGPGLEDGLGILRNVRERTGLPILTDVHSPQEAALAAEVVDIIQTPAFLCRQTDLLVAVGKTGKAVHLKKGQFLHPSDMKFAAEKIRSTGNKKILLCERGTCFGYRDLVVDTRNFLILSELGYPVVFDATHSVQSLGGQDGSSGGSRKFIPSLVRAAVATGVDGVFLECHECPDQAPSDGPSMLPLSDVEQVMRVACNIRSACQSS